MTEEISSAMEMRLKYLGFFFLRIGYSFNSGETIMGPVFIMQHLGRIFFFFFEKIPFCWN